MSVGEGETAMSVGEGETAMSVSETSLRDVRCAYENGES